MLKINPFPSSSQAICALPEAVGAVACRGRMIRREGERYATYQPENHEWRDWLCDRDEDGRLVGKDPMAFPLDVLSASGHPHATARSVLSRLKVMHGVDHGKEGDDGFLGLQPRDFPKRLTEIRERVCIPCSSGHPSEVRRCAIYDCPAFPYRMGRNPHNPRRGATPLAALRARGMERATEDGGQKAPGLALAYPAVWR